MLYFCTVVKHHFLTFILFAIRRTHKSSVHWRELRMNTLSCGCALPHSPPFVSSMDILKSPFQPGPFWNLTWMPILKSQAFKEARRSFLVPTTCLVDAMYGSGHSFMFLALSVLVSAYSLDGSSSFDLARLPTRVIFISNKTNNNIYYTTNKLFWYCTMSTVYVRRRIKEVAVTRNPQL